MTVPHVVAPASLPNDLTTQDTVVHQGLAGELLNTVLAESEQVEDRLPMGLNRFGQWCTKGLYGWTPHPSYMHAYQAAHADELA